MKCNNCGALLDADQLVCPYCGRANQVAADRKKELDKIEKENRSLRKEVLSKSREQIRYKIHKRVNLALLAVFVLVVVFSFVAYLFTEEQVWNREGGEADMNRYYEAGDLENLYLCMNFADLYDPEKYPDYGHAALIWNDYMDCQIYFASAYEEYEKTGFYDAWALEKCIDCGCDVLTGNLSYIYEELSEENKKKLTPYQEQVYILFTGALQIPEELIEEIYELEEYKHDEALIEYVLEVLPND